MRTLRSSFPTFLAGGLLAALLALPVSAGAQPESDGTTTRWTLDNGMRVVLQDVPAAPGVAVTVAYPFGSERDPAGMEGLAALLAEVAFTAPAGDLPQRTRPEMPGLRPLGWGIKVTPRFTLLTEVMPPDHLPGLLYEVSLRMSALSVTRRSLEDAVASVLEDQRLRHGGDAAWSLRQGVRDVATVAAEPASASRGTGIERLRPDDVRGRVAAALAPAGAVLTVAGPLGQQAVRELVVDLFGALPAGEPLEPVATAPLGGDSARVVMDGLERPCGALGIVGPAIDNPSHPEFYVHAVLIGAICSTVWGPPQPPVGAWFEFAVLDEPDLLRIYPPLPPDARSPEDVVAVMGGVLRGLMPNTVPVRHLQSVRNGVMWLVGGPLTGDIARQVARTPGIVYQLGQSLAARELTGGEAFWSVYRDRLSRVTMDVRAWRRYFELPEHQVPVIALPR